MEVAGKVIIETDVNQDGIDKGLEEVEKKLEQFDKISETRALTDQEQQEYNLRLFSLSFEEANQDTLLQVPIDSAILSSQFHRKQPPMVCRRSESFAQRHWL